jgi:hypothetical protein
VLQGFVNRFHIYRFYSIVDSEKRFIISLSKMGISSILFPFVAHINAVRVNAFRISSPAEPIICYARCKRSYFFRLQDQRDQYRVGQLSEQNPGQGAFVSDR